MQSEGQRLTAHLKATIAECERLNVMYCHAIDQLEAYTLPNLSPQSAAQWFQMVLPFNFDSCFLSDEVIDTFAVSPCVGLRGANPTR